MDRIIFTIINDLTYDQRMHRICTSLYNAGYEVLLIGRKLKDSVPLQDKPFRHKRLNLFFTQGKIFYIEYNIRLFWYLLFTSFDVVCGIDLDTILPCYFISKWKKKKCVYDAHELFPELPEVIGRPFTKKIWLLIERFSVSNINNWYTVSNGLANYFFKHYNRKFNVIRNLPLLDEHFSLNLSVADNSFIFYQGALNDGRGLEQLIDAMEDMPWKLILAGEGDLSNQLRKLVAEKKLSAQIEFLGRKQPRELRVLTSQSYIGVNLLENKGLSYYYSLANKFFDYVQAGIPVITMKFPEYEKLNQEYEVALLIDDLKKSTIKNAVQKLYYNKDYYFRLQENCLRARLEWNWQKEEQKLLSFYQQLQ